MTNDALQGLLSPLLLVIYINDLDFSIINMVSKFVDGSKIGCGLSYSCQCFLYFHVLTKFVHIIQCSCNMRTWLFITEVSTNPYTTIHLLYRQYSVAVVWTIYRAHCSISARLLG